MKQNKQTNNKRLALFVFYAVGLLSLISTTIFTQQTPAPSDQSTKPCTRERFVMPPTIIVGNEAFENYLRIAASPVKERRSAFAALSNEEKATFVRVRYALQLIKNPDFSKEQRDFILDAVLRTTADLFDKNDPEKVALNEKIGHYLETRGMGLFEPKKAAAILAATSVTRDEDVVILQAYQNLLKFGMNERKKFVSEMPMNERVNIWKTQMVYHLAASSFSDKQKGYIADLMPNIQSTIEASVNLPAAQKIKYVDELESGMFAIFTKMEAHAIFMSIGMQKVVRDTINGEGVGGGCDCRWYCDGTGHSCIVSPCRKENNCGPFDTWECFNVCVTLPD